MGRRLGTMLAALAVPLGWLAACGGDDGDLEAFCAAAGDQARFADLFDGLEPADVEAARPVYEEALGAERELRRDAPDAIRSDLDVLVRFFDDLVDGLDQVDPDDEGRPAIYDELRPRFDQVEAASARIETYVDANC